MLVRATFSDGRVIDVTDRTSFQSNESAIVAIAADGVATAGPLPGEAALMARYMDKIAVCQVAIPLPGEAPEGVYEQLPRRNFIDALVWEKLESLGVTPSDICSDETFVRRAYLDVLGILPEPEETVAFLADGQADKRERLIDALLQRPEYGDHWAAKWADLLRPNPYRVGIKATFNYDHWIREGFRKNKPYDQFVRELVTAQGSTWRNGAATLFRDRRSPDELATLFSQLFLGVRLDCAKCHHHPFERWSQDDFYSFAAFFARVGRKGTGLSPPISGGEEIVMVAKSGSVTHPLSGQTLAPRPLFGELPSPVEADEDLRVALAAWMTNGNPLFAQVMANRVWADLMGRGPGGADRRHTRHQSSVQRPAARAVGPAFRRFALRRESVDPRDRHLPCLPAQFPAGRPQCIRYAQPFAALSAAFEGRDAGPGDQQRDGCEVQIRRHAARLASQPDLDHARQLAVPGHIRASGSESGSAL